MSLTSPRLRRAALLSAGAWAVHELRFALAPVDGGDGPGHGYLYLLAPAIAAVLAIAAVGFAARLMAPRPERAPRGLVVDALGCAAILLVAFVVQEGSESMLSAHGPIFAAGGWLAAPLALAIGLLVALALRGASVTVAAIAVRGARPQAGPLLHRSFALPATRPRAAAPPRHLAARPPPGAPVPQY